MNRWKRLLIVVFAAALYVPAAMMLLIGVAALNWAVLGMCDFNCGPSPDVPEQIAAAIAIVVFAIGLLAGVAWVVRGGSAKLGKE